MAPVAPTHGPTSLTSLSHATPGAAGAAGSPQFASPSLVARTQRWIEDNQRLLLLGAAVAAAGGVGWDLYNKPSSSSRKPGSSSGSADSSAAAGEGGAAGAAKKKKNKKKKAGGLKEGFLKGEGSDGPLLEEIPEAEREKAKAVPPPASKDKEDDLFAGLPSTAAEIEAMPAAERNALAAQLKDKGNKLYSKKEFQKAVEVYSRAIEISAKKDAVFHSNRAACESCLCVKLEK